MAAPDPPPDQERDLRVWWGLGAGFVPVVLGLLAVGIGIPLNGNQPSGGLGILAAVGYVATIVAAITCLIVARLRYYGYGLLIMIFIGPVVWAVGCTVLFSSHA